MSEETKPQVPEVEEPALLHDTELEMYREYLRHTPIEDIAKKHGVSAKAVYKVAAKNDWKKKRRKAKEAAYKNLDSKYKDQIVDIVMFLERDLHLLMDRCRKENREMTKEERQYVMALRSDASKETRLNEGKPTEITENNGIVRHEVVLPPGVRRFGVIPPAANVTQVEAPTEKPVEPSPEDKVGLDDDEP